MGLREIIAGAVKVGLASLGNIPVDATLRLGRTLADYNPDTNSTREAFAHTIQIKATPTDVKELESVIGGSQGSQIDVEAITRAYVIEARLLPQGVDLKPGVVEANSDDITVDGTTWHIYAIQPDPLRITYTLLIRE